MIGLSVMKEVKLTATEIFHEADVKLQKWH